MIRIKFQNGPDAPEIFLDDEFETEAEAKKRLESLVQVYGTVDDAAAWLEGDTKPKGLAKAEEALAAKEEEIAAATPDPFPPLVATDDDAVEPKKK